jgi:acyl-CoA reductase-like NAD-dependent aldehyde dehydrogenase
MVAVAIAHSCSTPSRSVSTSTQRHKQSGIGRETHKMMLNHYQQTKNLLVSYSAKKLGFF